MFMRTSLPDSATTTKNMTKACNWCDEMLDMADGVQPKFTECSCGALCCEEDNCCTQARLQEIDDCETCNTFDGETRRMCSACDYSYTLCGNCLHHCNRGKENGDPPMCCECLAAAKETAAKETAAKETVAAKKESKKKKKKKKKEKKKKEKDDVDDVDKLSQDLLGKAKMERALPYPKYKEGKCETPGPNGRILQVSNCVEGGRVRILDPSPKQAHPGPDKNPDGKNTTDYIGRTALLTGYVGDGRNYAWGKVEPNGPTLKIALGDVYVAFVYYGPHYD